MFRGLIKKIQFAGVVETNEQWWDREVAELCQKTATTQIIHQAPLFAGEKTVVEDWGSRWDACGERTTVSPLPAGIAEVQLSMARRRFKSSTGKF